MGFGMELACAALRRHAVAAAPYIVGMTMLFSNRIRSNASLSAIAGMPTANRSKTGFLLRWNMRMERREPAQPSSTIGPETARLKGSPVAPVTTLM